MPRPDYFAGPDDRIPDEDHPPLDPSAPPISLDFFRSEYRHMIEYICGLFPQALGVPPVDPPPCALFESFFAPAPQSSPPLAFHWFERVHTALVDANSRLAAWLATGRSDCSFIPPRHTAYAVCGPHSSCRAVPVNESLLAHYPKPLRHSLQVGLSVSNLMALENSFRAPSVSLLCDVDYVGSAWVHSCTGLYSF